MHLIPRYNLLFLGLVLFLSCGAFLIDRLEFLNRFSSHYTYGVSKKDRLNNDTHQVSPVWSLDDISNRSIRFPSVEERVRLYMSDWYLPPCPNNRIHHAYQPERRSHIVTRANHSSREFIMSNFSSLFTFSLDDSAVRKCAKEEQKSYCIDVVGNMLPVLQKLNWSVNEIGHLNGETPVLMHFGDSMFISDIPVIQKFRTSLTREELRDLTSPQNKQCPDQIPRNPIIWKLNTARHYGSLQRVHRGDTAWSKKLPRAIFRGTLTGITDHAMNISDPEQRCLAIPRCRLVYQYANSSLLDARLTNTFGKLPDNLTNVPLVAPRESVESLLRFKAIIFLQGNDVSSGLKWGLYSQSVVLMPPPSFTSWAMEELLEPWVHYVPIRPDLQDVEEKIQWVIDNDVEAAKISFRGKVWMHDLALHPAAHEEESQINQQVLERYRKHWDSAHP